MSNAPRDPRARRNWGDDDSATPILHVDMDSFFAQVEMLEDPSLRGRPLIVGGTGNRGVVTSATYEVRELGVRAGMPTARARALCPQATVVPSSRGAYQRWSRRVMGILADVTPAVEQVSIDEAFMDVGGARLRLGGATSIARLLRERIRQETGLPASVGVACNKSVAKIASSHAKPDGMLLVPASATTDFLHGLPVGALWGVGGRTEEVLTREGIVTVGDLARTPMVRLVRVLGSAHAHHLHDLSMGVDPRPVRSGREDKSVGTERTFEEDVRSREDLEHFVLDASHSCVRRLRRAGMVGRTVVLKMRSGDFHTITRSLTLREPTDVGRVVAQAARTLLDREAIPATGVRLLGVRVEGLSSREDGVLVALDEDGRPLAAERAMDEIAARFGPGALRPATLVDPSSARARTESRSGASSH
ncbi:DNA polymerase IV [Schaalia sp. 19OD2882]|uniref:DNA polymerase IV n=1 Tax=Schaalia sp. 19OD2882 TaxID=2794089 RepID=UPI001C1F1523|nr:DNA polymerase IV [Schaalia sp. 19OD2882]QWW18949.1 DNA polymerase IV [Schaalia sp. 19OD2882]